MTNVRSSSVAVQSQTYSNTSDSIADKVAISLAFGKAAQSYDKHAAFQRDVADRLLSLLPENLLGAQILDLGCGTGYCTEQLIQRGAVVTCADLSEKMLEQAKVRCGRSAKDYVIADAERLPFDAESFDLVVSSLALQWCEDLAVPLNEMKRVTKKGGKLLFSTLLDGSLHELKESWSKIDTHQHVNDFICLDRLNIALAQSACVNHRLDLPQIVVWYQTAFELMRDLKGIGANHIENRSQGLVSRSVLQGVETEYRQFRNELGLLPASYHVCLGAIQL
ncbi:malonyl-ACP O-methyltransferase BioC [Vibrio sp. ZSDZ34]|jgi:malonyl-CoA O-methyltransferase|uniref:Malonyl-[acyl-carrier protein] O-methyltransferase n=1 Tax=Vibrio gelatinilyticus TaxID=2893468 RepID=A0A9X1W7I7_9VIBR|nr:malonyl-ACP O-methyltransferase BioC [Vibrio gelatinilyticus]MCJ2375408.1 malonyl-ACP O-methyltransferase BioC [Vibrio gelatinilyticus]